MALQPGTNKQVPDHAILDIFAKQAYLGNEFVYAIDEEITQTSEFPLFLFLNPAVTASSFPANWISLFMKEFKITCLTASQTAIMRVYLNPTVSANGTAETPINVRTGSKTASIAGLYLAPTISGNGTLIDVLSASPGLPDESKQMSIIDPGNSLLVTVQTSSNTTYIGAKVGWHEL